VDFYKARSELRRMSRQGLLTLVSAQRISGCLIGGRACGLCLRYKGFNFCVSEIMGEGCQVEKSAKLGRGLSRPRRSRLPIAVNGLNWNRSPPQLERRQSNSRFIAETLSQNLLSFLGTS
jgi:hypothetical protein